MYAKGCCLDLFLSAFLLVCAFFPDTHHHIATNLVVHLPGVASDVCIDLFIFKQYAWDAAHLPRDQMELVLGAFYTSVQMRVRQ